MDDLNIAIRCAALRDAIHNAGVGVELEIMWMHISLVIGVAVLFLMVWAVKRRLDEIILVARESETEEEAE